VNSEQTPPPRDPATDPLPGDVLQHPIDGAVYVRSANESVVGYSLSGADDGPPKRIVRPHWQFWHARLSQVLRRAEPVEGAAKPLDGDPDAPRWNPQIGDELEHPEYGLVGVVGREADRAQWESIGTAPGEYGGGRYSLAWWREIFAGAKVVRAIGRPPPFTSH